LSPKFSTYCTSGVLTSVNRAPPQAVGIKGDYDSIPH